MAHQTAPESFPVVLLVRGQGSSLLFFLCEGQGSTCALEPALCSPRWSDRMLGEGRGPAASTSMRTYKFITHKAHKFAGVRILLAETRARTCIDCLRRRVAPSCIGRYRQRIPLFEITGHSNLTHISHTGNTAPFAHSAVGPGMSVMCPKASHI